MYRGQSPEKANEVNCVSGRALKACCRSSDANVICVADCCYSGLLVSLTQQYQSRKHTAGRVFLTSTNAGQRAFFWTAVRNSGFTESLLTAMGCAQSKLWGADGDEAAEAMLSKRSRGRHCWRSRPSRSAAELATQTVHRFRKTDSRQQPLCECNTGQSISASIRQFR